MFTFFSETLSNEILRYLGMVQCQKDQRKDALFKKKHPLKGETPNHFRMFFVMFSLLMFLWWHSPLWVLRLDNDSYDEAVLF